MSSFFITYSSSISHTNNSRVQNFTNIRFHRNFSSRHYIEYITNFLKFTFYTTSNNFSNITIFFNNKSIYYFISNFFMIRSITIVISFHYNAFTHSQIIINTIVTSWFISVYMFNNILLIIRISIWYIRIRITFFNTRS